MIFNLFGEIENTSVNGPGNRYMIHLQGCPLKCPGCFNPESWSFKTKNTVNVIELAEKILSFAPDGLTISGGEPMMQSAALLTFLRYLHQVNAKPFPKGIIMYSGFTSCELEEIAEYKEILHYLSVIISGRFVQEKRVFDTMLSSSNQEFIFGGTGYLIQKSELSYQNFEIIDNKGVLQLTGFPPLTKEVINDLRSLGVSL